MRIFLSWGEGEFADHATLTDDDGNTALVFPEREEEDLDDDIWWAAEWDTGTAAALGLTDPDIGVDDSVDELARWMAADLGSLDGVELIHT